MAEIQTLHVAGQALVVLPQAEYERLRKIAGESDELPDLPATDAQGRFPAVAYAQASLARKIIQRRTSLGLSQAELARRARIRVETLNRLERGRTTPSLATVDKLDRALNRAERK